MSEYVPLEVANIIEEALEAALKHKTINDRDYAIVVTWLDQEGVVGTE